MIADKFSLNEHFSKTLILLPSSSLFSLFFQYIQYFRFRREEIIEHIHLLITAGNFFSRNTLMFQLNFPQVVHSFAV